MTTEATSIVSALISLLGSIVVGLVAWGWRGEIATLRAEIGTIHAQMETLRAEVRASIAEASAEFYRQVNGAYTKRDVCRAISDGLAERVDKLEERVNGL
jgi:uncharacterized coiled-coil DUF342 family protein